MLAGNVIVETVMKENTGNENDTQSAAPTKVHGNATNDVSINSHPECKVMQIKGISLLGV